MILGCTEAHEIEEVFLVVEGHVDAVLLEYLGELVVRDQVHPPVVHLPFALEAEPV